MQASKVFGEGPEFQLALKEAQKWRSKYSSAQEIPDGELPESFDWRSVGGYDFTSKIRDQKACGSCYTVAFVEAVESRLKVKYGKDIGQLSPQMLLSCNYMTEGCEGGWPHLQSFFSENGYLVSE